jgi:hypothetical protein
VDHISRSIILSSLAVLSLAVLAMAAAVLVPFDVDEPATARSLSGSTSLIVDDGSPVELAENDELEWEVGQTLEIGPGDRIALRFFNQGSAAIDGPATLKLLESRRRATALGHVLDSERFDCDYALSVQQTSGTITYNFAHATPPFEELTPVIDLPDRVFVPTTPCWKIRIDPDGAARIESTSCGS